MPDRHWMIYGLRDSQDDDEVFMSEVRYIGKSEDPYRRVKEHCVEALEIVMLWEDETDAAKALPGYGTVDLGDAPEPFTQWLAYHWRNSMLPEVVILENGVGPGWREREKFWIGAAKKLGLELFNKTGGG